MLMKPFINQPRIVSIHCVISLLFDLIYPFTTHQILRSMRHKDQVLVLRRAWISDCIASRQTEEVTAYLNVVRVEKRVQRWAKEVRIWWLVARRALGLKMPDLECVIIGWVLEVGKGACKVGICWGEERWGEKKMEEEWGKRNNKNWRLGKT